MSNDSGYGKPPKHTQFKKGTSGNPAGRPKGTRNFRSDFLDECASKIEFTQNGKMVRITKQRAVVKRLLVEAMAGKRHHLDMFLQFAHKYDLQEKVEGIDRVSGAYTKSSPFKDWIDMLSREDQARILAKLFEDDLDSKKKDGS